MKKTWSFIWEVAQIVIIALAIVIPIRYFLFQPFFVRGESMEPNFKDGDYLIVDEISYRLRDPIRGEVIVFNYPQNPSQRFIKRVIGLPGETVEVKDNKVSLTDKNGNNFTLNEANYLSSELPTIGDLKMTLKTNEFFVMGDNRPFSFDSRRFGVVPRNQIIGRALFRAWPLASINLFTEPVYN